MEKTDVTRAASPVTVQQSPGITDLLVSSVPIQLLGELARYLVLILQPSSIRQSSHSASANSLSPELSVLVKGSVSESGRSGPSRSSAQPSSGPHQQETQADNAQGYLIPSTLSVTATRKRVGRVMQVRLLL